MKADKKDLEKLLKKKTKELELANKKTEDLFNLKTQILNQVAHDIKSPLTPIRTLLPIIRRNVKDKISKDDLRGLDIIANNFDYLYLLVKNTLNFSKIESGSLEFEFEPVSLHQIISRIIENHKIIFQQKEINVINKVPPKIPLVIGDYIRISEVIENLIMNSMKYMLDNKRQLIFASKQDGKYITISIKDNGIGIEKSKLKNVFKEFYQINPNEKTVQPSTGLGLSICNKIISKHKGKIWAESKGISKGSTIYFTLPINKM